MYSSTFLFTPPESVLDRRVPDGRISKKFTRSQRRPSLIVPPRLALPVPSKPVKRWNFRKANWSHYNTLTNKLARSSLPPDSPDVDLAYLDFCNVIRTAAINSIPRGRRNNHISCWDAEYENLYRTFLKSPEGSDSNGAATALLLGLDKKRRDRWSEPVQIIDFSHNSQQAWSISNNLTGRTRHSPRHCALSANAIASQLIGNGRYEGIDCESTRLISQEVSDVWRATSTSSVKIAESFISQEFAAAHKHLKPGKTSGPDSICSDLITHAGAALKSWLCGFLSSCLRRLKIPKVWSRALVMAIPKPKKACRGPEKLSPHLLALRPLQDPRQAYTRSYNYEKELVKS